MLEIVAALDVMQKLPRHEKLAYKDHRTLPRYQLAYATMTPLLLSYLAHEEHVGLKSYLGNVQRFFCTLNEQTLAIVSSRRQMQTTVVVTRVS